MPDYEYRQTVVTLPVPVGESAAAEFRAVGRIPLVPGWKAAFGAAEPTPTEGFAVLPIGIAGPPIADVDSIEIPNTGVSPVVSPVTAGCSAVVSFSTVAVGTACGMLDRLWRWRQLRLGKFLRLGRR